MTAGARGLDWDGFEFYRLRQVPAAPAQPSEDERLDALGVLAAALTGAHSELLAEPRGSVAMAWARSPHDNELHVLLGGRPFFPPAASSPAGEDPRPILFPPGAMASPISEPDAGGLLNAYTYWVECAGRSDALWAPGTDRKGPLARRRGSFGAYAAHWPTPFAWLIIAEPLHPRDLKSELDILTSEIVPLSRTEVGEERRIELERKQDRFRELRRAQVGGAWRVRVIVGAMNSRDAETAAATLCAATDLEGLPYVLAPATPAASRADASGVPGEDEYGARIAFTSGTELLTALMRPPDRESRGIRMVKARNFDRTPERAPADGLHLGSVIDDAFRPAGEFRLAPETLNRHTFVSGATGGGKSMTVRHLLTEASRAGIPWLVVEPAKAEYARMAGRIADLGEDVIVIRPGDPDSPPAGFNPLAPAPGFPLQTHADLIGASFLAAFEANEPFPQVLRSALGRAYEELGWDLSLGDAIHPAQEPRYPTLGDLQRVAASVVTEIGYGAEVAADVQGFIKVRLDSLRLGTTGRFFEGGHPLDFTSLLSHNVVLEIEDVGDNTDKAFFMGAVLIRMTEELRMLAKADERTGLRHITVIEEAHRLLRRPEPGNSGASSHAVELFASMLAEVRAYGEGLVIAEQIPSKLATDVIKNTAVKILHRLPAKDDRDSVGATMNLSDDQSQHVVALVPGEAAVYADGMDRPMLVRIPDGSDTESVPNGQDLKVSDLIGRRSLTCGADCLTRACTLRELRTAQRLVAERPWITTLAELTVLAHLAGLGPPDPQPGDIAARLRDVPVRTVDCALSQAVDQAVAVRSRTLQPEMSAADLAGHCVLALRMAFVGDVPVGASCEGDAHNYLAAHYRWLKPLIALERAVDHDGPHPETEAWQQRLHTTIPGATCAEQLVSVTRWWDLALDDHEARDRVTYGALRPSTLERAIGATAGTVAWHQRVNDLKSELNSNWLGFHLLTDEEQRDE